ncbi:hypothetical protein [Leptospira borgpetersenii]|nr:hypothetical protein [Leptospira borgpetersenii]UVA62864.1 hypothetical protein LH336_08465 [Leptospira borgpetersenii]
MLFSNELNYWVIKKNAKKDLLLRMRAPYQNLSQNCPLLEQHYRDTVISPLNVGVPTETVTLAVFSCHLRL